MAGGRGRGCGRAHRPECFSDHGSTSCRQACHCGETHRGLAGRGRRAYRCEAARHPDLCVLVAENVRYEPRFRRAFQLLEAGELASSS